MLGSVRKMTPEQRGYVGTVADYLDAIGYPPYLASDEAKLVGGPGQTLYASISIDDNAAGSDDLTLQSVWDRAVQKYYGTSNSTKVRGQLILFGVSVYINDAITTESLANLALIDNGLYLNIDVNGNGMDIPLRGSLHGPVDALQFAQAAAAAETRFVLPEVERPIWLPRPIGIDLEVDTFTANWGAVNMAAALPAYIKCHGIIAPKGFPGTEINHVNALSYFGNPADQGGNAFHVAPPGIFGQIRRAFLGRSRRA